MTRCMSMVEEDLRCASISGEEVDADEMERMQRLRNEVEEKVSAMLPEFNGQKARKPPPASTTATAIAVTAPAAAAPAAPAAAAAAQGGEQTKKTAASIAAAAPAAAVAGAAATPGGEVANEKPGAQAPGGGPGDDPAQKKPPMGVRTWNDYASLGAMGVDFESLGAIRVHAPGTDTEKSFLGLFSICSWGQKGLFRTCFWGLDARVFSVSVPVPFVVNILGR
jgi:hypothetical protein